MRKKKIVSMLTSVIMFFTMNSYPIIYSQSSMSVCATDVESESVLTTGDGLWESAADWSVECCDYEFLSINQLLSSSVDNSTSIYFPSIGNQGEINSCAAWSTTYYQYTYEVNKLKGIATTNSNVYSPTWTYNYINGGANNPTYLEDAYRVLENQGAMFLTDFPYSTNESTYSYDWSTNEQKMIDALEYRVSSYYVSCPSSSSLNNIKTQLSDGKIGVVWTNCYGWTTATTSNDESIIVRGSSNGNGGHFMTIVGYDDNVTCVYNGTTFTGAFKLANSWGTNWSEGNDGYIWVAYDALNTTGINNWDSSLTNRSQIFGSNNEVNFINISHFHNYYVGKVVYISNDPWRNNIYGDIGTYASSGKFLPLQTYYNNGGTSVNELSNPSYKMLVFDYFTNSSQDVANYINSAFTSRLYNPTSSITYRIYHTLIDNKGGVILPNDDICGSLPSNGGSYSRTFNVALKKGRISSYDNNNLTSADASLLQSYLHGNSILSSLQIYLADMNDDDVVNVIDLALLKHAILAQNGILNNSENILSEYIPEFGCTLREFIFSEMGNDGVEYVETLLN